MNRFTSLTVAALLTFCAGSAFAQEGPTTPTVSADSAQTIALKEVPGGTVQSQDLKTENGVAFYAFAISSQTGVEEVHVDANTGEVISHEAATPAAAPSQPDTTQSLPGVGSDQGAPPAAPGGMGAPDMGAPQSPQPPVAPTP